MLLGACLCAVNCARRITSSAEAVLWMFLKIAVAKHGIIVLYVGACGSSVCKSQTTCCKNFTHARINIFVPHAHKYTYTQTHMYKYLYIHLQDIKP